MPIRVSSSYKQALGALTFGYKIIDKGVENVEAESAEVLTAANYQLALAGASLWNVPEMEMPVAGVTEVEKKMNR